MHWALFAVIAASALAVWYLGWSPIHILIAAAAIGIIAWTLFIAKKQANDLLTTVRKLPENRVLRLRRRLRHARSSRTKWSCSSLMTTPNSPTSWPSGPQINAGRPSPSTHTYGLYGRGQAGNAWCGILGRRWRRLLYACRRSR